MGSHVAGFEILINFYFRNFHTRLLVVLTRGSNVDQTEVGVDACNELAEFEGNAYTQTAVEAFESVFTEGVYFRLLFI